MEAICHFCHSGVSRQSVNAPNVLLYTPKTPSNSLGKYTFSFVGSHCHITSHSTTPRPINWARLLLFLRYSMIWGAAIAQWIRLCLPFCRPGFESQARHLRFFIYSICATFVM